MKNLIVASIGDRFPNQSFESWISGNPNFDIMAIYYGSLGFLFNQISNKVNYSFKFQHTNAKFHCMYDKRIKDIIFKYDYILFADDDVLINTDDLNQLFEIAKEENLQICQPAINNTTYKDFLAPQTDQKVRYTNFVEIMFPLFSKDALHKCLKSLLLTESSWGADIVWWYILGENLKSMGIIDCIQANHIGELNENISRFKNPTKDILTTLNYFGLQKLLISYNDNIRNL